MGPDINQSGLGDDPPFRYLRKILIWVSRLVNKGSGRYKISMATNVDIKQLLEAGAHFGHKTSRWHPKMAQYIHSKRDGTHIIDLTKTVTELDKALDFLEKTASTGKQIILVGTKLQAQSIVLEAAVATGMPYVVNRWLGGMLTNRNTISGRIKHLKDIESKLESGELASKYNKLEVQRFEEEIAEMNYLYGGIKDLNVNPGAMFIADIISDANAVREAKKLGIKTVAIVDTNVDPTLIDYPIPANDDAIKSLKLIVGYVQQAITTGKNAHVKKADKVEATKTTESSEKENK